MEPHFRYARTSDGVNIAYYVIGQGRPYLWPAAAPMGSIEDHWKISELRKILEGIAQSSLLVSFNHRGCGLSDRDTTDFSCDAMVRDFEAVCDAAELDHFTLQVWSYMAIPALAYAARHPERLAALVLLNGIIRGSDLSAKWNELLRIVASDWEFALRWMAQSNEPGYALTLTLEQSRKIAEKEASKEAFIAFSEEMSKWDASSVAGGVTTPALVAHYGNSLYVPREASRRLAAALPNGSFAPVEATAEDSIPDAARRTIRGFLRGVLPRQERTADAVQGTAKSGTAIILFADIADSTALTERLGDAAFRAKARELDTAMRTIIREHSGTCIDAKTLGDGVLATFASARHAIEAALACGRAGDDAGLPLHLGLHAGDVIREEGNVFGGAVNVAARVSGLAAPGEVLVSETVRSLARTSAGVTFEDCGEQSLKGVGEPLRVWVVREGSNAR